MCGQLKPIWPGAKCKVRLGVREWVTAQLDRDGLPDDSVGRGSVSILRQDQGAWRQNLGSDNGPRHHQSDPDQDHLEKVRMASLHLPRILRDWRWNQAD
jgi:hypothetical protein